MLRSCWMAVAAMLLLCGAAAAQTSAYWLGIECLPVMPALRAQLNLPERQGLLIGSIMPSSPADAAGIVRHDILLRIGDRIITNPHDLMQAVDAAKGGKIEIELLRGGKPKTVEATPAKRPEQAGVAMLPSGTTADWETVQKWMEGMMSNQENGGSQLPSAFSIIGGPGFILPQDMLGLKALPAGMSIMISKSGDQPAKITVQHGDQKMELTEKELDKLPADVRPYVEQMLGHGLPGFIGNVQAIESPHLPKTSGQSKTSESKGPKPSASSGAEAIDQRLEKRLDEMSRRIDRLMEMMEKMAAGHENPPPAK